MSGKIHPLEDSCSTSAKRWVVTSLKAMRAMATVTCAEAGAAQNRVSAASSRTVRPANGVQYTRRGNIPACTLVGSGRARTWESIKAEGSAVLDRLKDLVHEGNIRRVRVRQGARTIAEFPLTAGVVGAVLAPMLAAIGALVALAKDCTIEVQREDTSLVVTDPQRDTSAA